MGEDSIRLELLARWKRPPVVVPHPGTLRTRVAEAAGIEAPPRDTGPGAIERGVVASPAGATFAGKIASSRRICLVMPDATRVGPWRIWAEAAAHWLAGRGRSDAHRTILFATGVHRPRIPPGLDLPGWTLLANGEGGYGSHREVGTTAAGTPVRLHPAWVDADLRVVLGDVSFHYFAGFGGGRKLVFPGLGEPSGILRNHKKCLDLQGNLHPACESGVLVGNPVQMDLLDAVALAPPDLLIQAFEATPGESPRLGCGDWREEHERACAIYRTGHTLEFTQTPEVMIADAGGSPRDASLLQAHKSLRHAARFLSPGGRLLLVAGLEEGSGSESFERLWRRPARELSRLAVEAYELHTHTALSLRTICESIEVGIWSRMEPGRLAPAGIRPFARVEDALGWLEEGGTPRAWGWLARAEEVLPRLAGQGGG